MPTAQGDATWTAPGRAETVAMVLVIFPIFQLQAQFILGPYSRVLPLMRVLRVACWPDVLALAIVVPLPMIALGVVGDVALAQYASLVLRHQAGPPGRVPRVLLTTVVSVVLCLVWPGAVLVDGLRAAACACRIGWALAAVARAVVSQMMMTASFLATQQSLSCAEAELCDSDLMENALAWGNDKLARVAQLLPDADRAEQLATVQDTLIWRATRVTEVPLLTWWLAWTMIAVACQEHFHLPKKQGPTRKLMVAMGLGAATVVEVTANLIQILQAHLPGLQVVALLVTVVGGAGWMAWRARGKE